MEHTLDKRRRDGILGDNEVSILTRQMALIILSGKITEKEIVEVLLGILFAAEKTAMRTNPIVGHFLKQINENSIPR